ncbi:secretory carrier-associated membrane protein 4-like isoform X6 [Camellia sinensis]|uniref:secretory carrier-associated membrane protein 4-like isoform X6 n=1 Tax=Camellia sinensis TaxID=4442 RepID=UPI001036AB29|nr:secretory carrier-associated membrane protein 4-like isoform X6 [Camellia sinensis]
MKTTTPISSSRSSLPLRRKPQLRLSPPPLLSRLSCPPSLSLQLRPNGSAAPKSRIPQMVAQTLGFGQKHNATVDIPLDSMNDPKKKEKEFSAWEADLKRRERVCFAFHY